MVEERPFSSGPPTRFAIQLQREEGEHEKQCRLSVRLRVVLPTLHFAALPRSLSIFTWVVPVCFLGIEFTRRLTVVAVVAVQFHHANVTSLQSVGLQRRLLDEDGDVDNTREEIQKRRRTALRRRRRLQWQRLPPICAWNSR